MPSHTHTLFFSRFVRKSPATSNSRSRADSGWRRSYLISVAMFRWMKQCYCWTCTMSTSTDVCWQTFVVSVLPNKWRSCNAGRSQLTVCERDGRTQHRGSSFPMRLLLHWNLRKVIAWVLGVWRHQIGRSEVRFEYLSNRYNVITDEIFALL